MTGIQYFLAYNISGIVGIPFVFQKNLRIVCVSVR